MGSGEGLQSLLGDGGLGGILGNSGVTNQPFTAQASGGPVTIPQGSQISEMAPGLTGFEPQAQQGMNWGAALKGLTQGMPNPQGMAQPQVPGMTIPQTPRYGTGGGSQGQAGLGGMPMISMPLIHSALQALKGRMGSF